MFRAFPKRFDYFKMSVVLKDVCTQNVLQMFLSYHDSLRECNLVGSMYQKYCDLKTMFQLQASMLNRGRETQCS